MKSKKPIDIVNNYKPGLPQTFICLFLSIVCKVYCAFHHVKFNYEFDIKRIKGKQIILLSDHSCREQYFYTFGGLPFKKLNPVVSYQNFLKKSLQKNLMKIGAIPKFLFIHDASCVRNIIQLKNKGASFLLYPEGIQSASGVNEPINPATFKLLKKLGLDIVLCSSKGAFLTNTRFSRSMYKGKVEVTYKHLFTKEELENSTEEEIKEKVLDNFRYNDFEWNEKEQNSYFGKKPITHRINELLYRCPKCNKDFELEVHGNNLICKSCGNTIHIDEKYNISPLNNSYLPFKRIDEWYFKEREIVKKEIEDKDFKMEAQCTLVDLSYDKLLDDQYIDVGKGMFVLDQTGISYDGTRKREKFSVKIPIKDMPSISYRGNNSIELYYEKNCYSFRFDNSPLIVLKLTIAVQEMHRKVNKAWDEAWNEVKKR